VLRELDDDGRLGLRDADYALLDGLAHPGFPRALEAVKAILDSDGTLTPRDLLARTRDLPEDQVVRALVGEAYELLDTPGKQVMQALAIFPAPVSAVGVDFLLAPVNPTTDAALVLARLVRRQLARFRDGLYHLHPVDRDYARHQIPPGAPGDAPALFTRTGLQARAAGYYTQIRTPASRGAAWRTCGRSWPSSSCAAPPATTTPPPPSCKTSTSATCRCGATTAPWSSCTPGSTGRSSTLLSTLPICRTWEAAATAWGTTGRPSACTPKRSPRDQDSPGCQRIALSHLTL
jgi:hypothetical protein